MEDLLRYYHTRGGLVHGKSKRAKHPHLEKMPDYRPEEELDFLPILDPKKTATKDSPAESSTDGTQASTVVDLIEDMSVLNDEYIFASTYNTTETGDETVNLDQYPYDDNEKINLTGQIQATLSSTVEFKEYVEDTQNIDGNFKLSENQVVVEELFIGKQWLSKELCRNYLKELALDKNYCMVQVKNKKMKQSYKCKDETCEWKVYCSALNDGQTFECKPGHFIHTCQSYNGITHPLANARWVSKVMLECFKAHPNYNPWDFMTEQHLRALTFISDRQKGLIEEVSANFGYVNHFHRYCFRHLYKNFKKLHPGKNLEFLAWRAARSFSEVGHNIWMDRLKEPKPSAPEWFDREPVETWARAYFDMSSKCEHITSNFCEALFNSWILELRNMPIYKLRTSG
ncbi:hypothetical protein MKX03_008232 [Papaver bracteatum]|nr:hypothetical protein MKX03_008232 [Papaver bracteatum]